MALLSEERIAELARGVHKPGQPINFRWIEDTLRTAVQEAGEECAKAIEPMTLLLTLPQETKVFIGELCAAEIRRRLAK